MIELLNIPIVNTSVIVALRNKVLLLAHDLDYSERIATRLSIVASELGRSIFQSGKDASFFAGFEKKQGQYHLLMNFSTKADRLSVENMEQFFDSFQVIESKDSVCEVKTRIALPSAETKIDNTFIELERDRLVRQSRAELMKEVQHKNEELNKLLEDLKKSSSMVQTEKMRALGEMVAGVAHELNNPMMGIMNYIQYCIKKTDEDDRRWEVLKDAEKEIKRCVDIVSNLLTFSRMEKEGDEGLGEADCSSLLERVLNLVAYKLRSEQIEVVKNFDENVPKINVRVNSIQQVFLNLIGNAIDAMKKVDERKLTLGCHQKEDFVEVTISDTGHGIDEETLDKIFEPFFSTKPTGQGTGLGLSVTLSIIKSHNGQLKCGSQVGKGTTFTILLPINNKKKEEGNE